MIHISVRPSRWAGQESVSCLSPRPLEPELALLEVLETDRKIFKQRDHHQRTCRQKVSRNKCFLSIKVLNYVRGARISCLFRKRKGLNLSERPETNSIGSGILQIWNVQPAQNRMFLSYFFIDFKVQTPRASGLAQFKRVWSVVETRNQFHRIKNPSPMKTIPCAKQTDFFWIFYWF